MLDLTFLLINIIFFYEKTSHFPEFYLFFSGFVVFFRKRRRRTRKNEEDQENQRLAGQHCGKMRSQPDDRVAGTSAAAFGVGKNPETDFRSRRETGVSADPSCRTQGRTAGKFHSRPVQIITREFTGGISRFHAELMLELIRLLAEHKYECVVQIGRAHV